MVVSDEESFEDILIEAGGFGRFQLTVYLVLNMLMLTPVSWNILLMEYTAARPEYQCIVFVDKNNRTENVTERNVCEINGTRCDVIDFIGDMETVVSEWCLVCDKKWIPQTITTIQMTGQLVGGIVFGQISDNFGRKPTLFFCILMLGSLNTVAYFSSGWIMFAILKFLCGMACAGFFSSMISFEFIRNNVRVWLTMIPGWEAAVASLALFCWQVHKWRYIHVAIASMTVLSLPFWFVFPESYRWLLSKERFQEAKEAIAKVARFNGKSVPNMDKYMHIAHSANRKSKTYSLIDLFRESQLRKITILFGLIWLFSAFTYYGMAFAVQELSGNFYLNLFLIGLVDFPGNFLLAFFNLCLGRKWTSASLLLFAGLFALTVGVSKTTHATSMAATSNVLALLSKLCVSAGFNMSTIWAIESFPTVARYIGTGFISSLSSVGSLTAPQIITLSLDIPGLLYLVAGTFCVLSSIICTFLEETKDKDLRDIIQQSDAKHSHRHDEKTLLIQNDE